MGGTCAGGTWCTPGVNVGGGGGGTGGIGWVRDAGDSWSQLIVALPRLCYHSSTTQAP